MASAFDAGIALSGAPPWPPRASVPRGHCIDQLQAKPAANRLPEFLAQVEPATAFPGAQPLRPRNARAGSTRRTRQPARIGPVGEIATHAIDGHPEAIGTSRIGASRLSTPAAGPAQGVEHRSRVVRPPTRHPDPATEAARPRPRVAEEWRCHQAGHAPGVAGGTRLHQAARMSRARLRTPGTGDRISGSLSPTKRIPRCAGTDNPVPRAEIQLGVGGSVLPFGAQLEMWDNHHTGATMTLRGIAPRPL